MHIVIAPNSFKHSLDAASAASAIERGLQSGCPACTTTCAPVGDGGDETGRLLTHALGGALIQHTVHDPLQRVITAEYGWVNGNTAVIEMASASGIRLLQTEERDPLSATSYGTGELMLQALNEGAEKILLCVGGSATVDGGCGILRALGVRFLDAARNELHHLPAELDRLAAIDIAGIDGRLQRCELVIICDVTNPLLGDKGAAAVFGPQKGATPQQVTMLEQRLQHFARVLQETTGIDVSTMRHGGAAGGVVAGLCGLAGAKAVHGIDYFLDCIAFDRLLENADLVITGEGSIDEQTLEGKAPFGVAVRARRRNIPVIALAGKVPDTVNAELHSYFREIIGINKTFTSLADALAATERNLEAAAYHLGASL